MNANAALSHNVSVMNDNQKWWLLIIGNSDTALAFGDLHSCLSVESTPETQRAIPLVALNLAFECQSLRCQLLCLWSLLVTLTIEQGFKRNKSMSIKNVKRKSYRLLWCAQDGIMTQKQQKKRQVTETQTRVDDNKLQHLSGTMATVATITQVEFH